MLFNFDSLAPIVAEVYEEVDTSYTLQDVLAVLRYFLAAYEFHRGEVHPNIRRGQLRRIIRAMDTYELDGLIGGQPDVDPDDYPALIDAYFETSFPRCDYRINHFFSGKIRALRAFESVF